MTTADTRGTCTHATAGGGRRGGAINSTSLVAPGGRPPTDGGNYTTIQSKKLGLRRFPSLPGLPLRSRHFCLLLASSPVRSLRKVVKKSESRRETPWSPLLFRVSEATSVPSGTMYFLFPSIFPFEVPVVFCFPSA